jgi:AcrR family transcriptional regulator
MVRRGRRRGADGSSDSDQPRSGASTTRERILDVALDLFIRKGYAETSLREIAAELGFSKAALYYHFESKQDIMLALHVRMHNMTEALLPALRDSIPTDPREVGLAWEGLLAALIGVALRNRRLIELHLRNREVLAELHTGEALHKHGPIEHHAEDRIRGLLQDASAPVEERVRRMASLGVIGAILLGSDFLSDVPDGALETSVRQVVHDILSRGAAD